MTRPDLVRFAYFLEVELAKARRWVPLSKNEATTPNSFASIGAVGRHIESIQKAGISSSG
jgi:hypothetical protein